ncbi:membrane progestin receptor delta isoform X2 [Athene cunicularia]|uniref:membrane progestin receptor delta isoform X2 n=1 Tax=Athene cunicularia TaxID=194338 RepID=UPI000EF6C39B|nr:membrane progestin receptor delta isoform X2 [Athene cunicularia]
MTMRQSTSGHTSYRPGISCGASWCSHPPWTSAGSPTTGPCSRTCCSSASTPWSPAAPTPPAPCGRAPATSATSVTPEPSASTAWAVRSPAVPTQCQTTGSAAFCTVTLSPWLLLTPLSAPASPATPASLSWSVPVLRTAAFVYPFLYDNIPLFYRLLFCFFPTFKIQPMTLITAGRALTHVAAPHGGAHPRPGTPKSLTPARACFPAGPTQSPWGPGSVCLSV